MKLPGSVVAVGAILLIAAAAALGGARLAHRCGTFDARAWRASKPDTGKRRALAAQLRRCQPYLGLTAPAIRRRLGRPDDSGKGAGRSYFLYVIGADPVIDTDYLELDFGHAKRLRAYKLAQG